MSRTRAIHRPPAVASTGKDASLLETAAAIKEAQRPLAELTNDDLWEHAVDQKKISDHSLRIRKDCFEELDRRCDEASAKRLPLSEGHIVRVETVTYTHSESGLIALGKFLMERGWIQKEEWDDKVRWTPHVSDGRWLKALADYGEEAKALVEATRVPKQGAPKWEERNRDGRVTRPRTV